MSHAEREGRTGAPEMDKAETSTPQITPDRRVPLVIGGAVAVVLLAGGAMFVRANARTNQVALASSPKGVTVVEAKATTYRRSRKYVGTVAPWLSANVGPQLVSAYVDTVLLRPGAAVKRGDVVATLDCRNASAQSQAVAMQARALEAKQAAIAHEATRVSGLLDGGFVSPNEAEQKKAESASQEAGLLAEKAKLLGRSLEVNDCVLRAPFDGEVADRMIDPGAFARPGTPIVSLVDRSTVRVALEVPEIDFGAVAPGTPVKLHVIATGGDIGAPIARRAPSADPATRTVHVEIDVPDPERRIPVGTTAEATLDIGDAMPAIELPLAAAAVRGNKAKLFVVENDVAKDQSVEVLGESGGTLFVATTLAPGTLVVTEGRSLLAKGDKVNAKRDGVAGTPHGTAATPPASPSGSAHAVVPAVDERKHL